MHCGNFFLLYFNVCKYSFYYNRHLMAGLNEANVGGTLMQL